MASKKQIAVDVSFTNAVIAALFCIILIVSVFSASGTNSASGAVLLSVLSLAVLYALDKKVFSSPVNIYFLFFVRLCLLFLLYSFGWAATLRVGNAYASYDPAKYYYQALELVKNGSDNIQWYMNYMGIIYWYAAIFKLFGTNPYVVIILNNLMTIITSLIVGNIFSSHSKEDKRSLSGIVTLVACFVPELLWYDCLSSREIICMMLIAVMVFIFHRSYESKKIHIPDLIVLILCVFLLGVIRMSLLIVVAALAALIILIGEYNRTAKTVIALMTFGVLITLPLISRSIGSVNNSFGEILNNVVDQSLYSDEQYHWTENSIGRMLVVDSLWKLALLSPIRLMVYIVAPLPTISFSLSSLAASNYSAWQSLCSVLSALLYTISIPRMIATVLHGFKKKDELLFPSMIFIVMMLSAANGTQFIHERYRIIAVPWIVLTVALSVNTDKKERKIGLAAFAVMMFFAASVYIIIKW